MDPPSYRMLETVREYAAERLREAEGELPLRRGHRDCFVALAEVAEPELTSRNQATWMRRLRANDDNLRAALEFSLGGTTWGA